MLFVVSVFQSDTLSVECTYNTTTRQGVTQVCMTLFRLLCFIFSSIVMITNLLIQL